MILKYEEALKNAENKDWFLSFYRKDEIADDATVDLINQLVRLKGEKYLFNYFGIEDDMLLQKEYAADLIDFLSNLAV